MLHGLQEPPSAMRLLGLLAYYAVAVGAVATSDRGYCSARLELFFRAALDRSGDGQLSLQELHLARTASAHGETPPLAASDAAGFMQRADASGDGSLSFWELCTALGGGRPATSGTASALDGQVKLSLTGRAGEMRVSFVTKQPLQGRVAVSVANGLNTTVAATTSHYTVPKREWEPQVHTSNPQQLDYRNVSDRLLMFSGRAMVATSTQVRTQLIPTTP